MTRVLALSVALAALTLPRGCNCPLPGVPKDEMDVIRHWLSCEECDKGERQALVGLSPKAVPVLAQALAPGSRGDRVLRESLEASVRAQLAFLPADSATDTAVLFFRNNELRRVQERAAIALGDLGAVAKIQEILDDRATRGLDSAVVRALESARLRAITRRLSGAVGRVSGSGAVVVPPRVRVSVLPDSVQLEVGNVMTFSAQVLDTISSVLPGEAVTWTLAHPPGNGAVSLYASGVLTALAPGADTVIATHSSGSEGRATVRVTPRSSIPLLRIDSGNHQSAMVGSQLPSPVVVEMKTPEGTAAPRVRVAWAVESGGGALVSTDSVTDSAGRARARWRLGGAIGPQRASVTGPDGLLITLRARGALSTTIQGVIINDRNLSDTLDPDEALPGVPVRLYKDGSPPAEVAADSLVAVDTTDNAGVFRFTDLPAGVYIVQPVPGLIPGWPVRVLRSDTGGDTALVRTAEPEPQPGSGNPDATLVPGIGGRTVGIASGFGGALVLPRWDHDRGAMNLKAAVAVHRQPHFTFLFGDGTVQGRVLDGASALAGVTVRAVRCATSSGTTSPPTVDTTSACVSAGAPMATTTDAAGSFRFSGLLEGAWRVTVEPYSVGRPGPIRHALYLLRGRSARDSVAFDLR